MIGQPFINPVLSHAIEMYLKYKDHPEDPNFSEFTVMVVRTLVFIYGELDILNPYITHNEHMMGGFDSNITKYGFSIDALTDFKNQFLKFVEEQQKNIRPNSAFIKIQKYLIDMYSYKQKTMNLPIDQLMLFKKYLYIPENGEKIAEINRYLINPQEIIGYLNSKIYETNHNFILEPVKRETLNTDAYILLGYNMNQIKIPLLISMVDSQTGTVYIASSKETRVQLLDNTEFITDVPIGIAVRASCSFPVVFSPCEYQDLQLIDGGTRENLPWKGLKQIGADEVFGISFNTIFKKKDCCQNLIDVAERAMELQSRELSTYEKAGIDKLITINMKKVSLLDSSKMEELYELGYEQTKKQMH